jgi:DNA-binding transcriptional ArsR family regulator
VALETGVRQRNGFAGEQQASALAAFGLLGELGGGQPIDCIAAGAHDMSCIIHVRDIDSTPGFSRFSGPEAAYGVSPIDFYLDVCLNIYMNHQQTVWKALADPTRRGIIRTLKAGSKTAGDIADEFPMTRASLSHHFNALKAADLVRTERRGQHIVYSLNTSVLDDMATILMDLFAPKDQDKEQEG